MLTKAKASYTVNSHCCGTCGKEYISKASRDKHSILCRVKTDSRKKKRANLGQDEEDNIYSYLPTQREMYKIILELYEKNSLLETRVNKMTELIRPKKRKKIDVIELLNSRQPPSFPFKSLANKIIIDDAEVQIILQSTFFDAFPALFTSNLPEGSLPLVAFSEKKELYCYHLSVEEGVPSGWEVLSEEKLRSCLNSFHFNCMKAVRRWWNHLDVHSEKDTNTYNMTTVKWSVIDFESPLILGRARNIIYEKIKVGLHEDAVEYDFV